MKQKQFRIKLMVTLKKSIAMLLLLCLTVLLWVPADVSAAEEPTDTITIQIGDKTYEDITAGSTIKGDFDLEDLTFWVISANGKELVNVGNKSDAVDYMGRNPLEVATENKTDTAWLVTLIYHAMDDPVESNQFNAFAIVGLTFTTSDQPVIEEHTVEPVTDVKATRKSKAIKLTWQEAPVDGYELQYSTSKTFKDAKKLTLDGTQSSTTIKKLKAKKTYYIRIRAYKSYTDELDQLDIRHNVYSEWVTIKRKTK